MQATVRRRDSGREEPAPRSATGGESPGLSRRRGPGRCSPCTRRAAAGLARHRPRPPDERRGARRKGRDLLVAGPETQLIEVARKDPDWQASKPPRPTGSARSTAPSGSGAARGRGTDSRSTTGRLTTATKRACYAASARWSPSSGRPRKRSARSRSGSSSRNPSSRSCPTSAAEIPVSDLEAGVEDGVTSTGGAVLPAGHPVRRAAEREGEACWGAVLGITLSPPPIAAPRARRLARAGGRSDGGRPIWTTSCSTVSRRISGKGEMIPFLGAGASMFLLDPTSKLLERFEPRAGAGAGSRGYPRSSKTAQAIRGNIEEATLSVVSALWSGLCGISRSSRLLGRARRGRPPALRQKLRQRLVNEQAPFRRNDLHHLLAEAAHAQGR